MVSLQKTQSLFYSSEAYESEIQSILLHFSELLTIQRGKQTQTIKLLQESKITLNTETEEKKKEAVEKMSKPVRDICCRERCRGRASTHAGPWRPRRPYNFPLLALSVKFRERRGRESRVTKQCKNEEGNGKWK